MDPKKTALKASQLICRTDTFTEIAFDLLQRQIWFVVYKGKSKVKNRRSITILKIFIIKFKIFEDKSLSSS